MSDRRERAAAFIAGYQDRLGALKATRLPCQVVGFARDSDTFAVRAREVADAVPDCRHVELSGTAHLLPVTGPARVIALVLTFFAARAAPPAVGTDLSPGDAGREGAESAS